MSNQGLLLNVAKTIKLVIQLLSLEEKVLAKS